MHARGRTTTSCLSVYVAGTSSVKAGSSPEGDSTDELVNTTGTMIVKPAVVAGAKEAEPLQQETETGGAEEMCLANTAGTMIIKPGGAGAAAAEKDGDGPGGGEDAAASRELQGAPMLGAGVGRQKSPLLQRLLAHVCVHATDAHVCACLHVRVCVVVIVSVYLYMLVNAHELVYVHVYVCLYVRMHTRMCMYMCLHIFPYMFVNASNMCK
jgi:hypothetical protein